MLTLPTARRHQTPVKLKTSLLRGESGLCAHAYLLRSSFLRTVCSSESRQHASESIHCDLLPPPPTILILGVTWTQKIGTYSVFTAKWLAQACTALSYWIDSLSAGPYVHCFILLFYVRSTVLRCSFSFNTPFGMLCSYASPSTARDLHLISLGHHCRSSMAVATAANANVFPRYIRIAPTITLTCLFCSATTDSSSPHCCYDHITLTAWLPGGYHSRVEASE